MPKENRLKILISAALFYPHSFGGGETYIYRLAKELLCRGHEVRVLAQAPHEEIDASHEVSHYDYNGVQVTSLRINPSAVSPREGHTGFGQVVCEAVRDILSEFRPDLVHINAMKPALVSICNELDIPHVVTAHHAGIVCPAGGLLRKDGSICSGVVSEALCVPCCTRLRWAKLNIGGLIGCLPEQFFRPLGKRLNEKEGGLKYLERGLIYPWLVEQSIAIKREMLEQAKVIVAPSRYMRDVLLRNGTPPEKIRLVHHGVEPLKTSAGENNPGVSVRFGYVGRIEPGKGLHLLLEAARLLPDGAECEVHIFGATRNRWDEDYFQKALAAYRGKSKVIHHGFVAPDKLAEAFESFDVLVVPSILPESFGLVVLEAFSAGRPVIVADSGALPELVRGETDGLIVARNNSAALAEAMMKFLSNQATLAAMTRRITPVRDIRQHTEEIEAIYSQITAP